MHFVFKTDLGNAYICISLTPLTLSKHNPSLPNTRIVSWHNKSSSPYLLAFTNITICSYYIWNCSWMWKRHHSDVVSHHQQKLCRSKTANPNNIPAIFQFYKPFGGTSFTTFYYCSRCHWRKFLWSLKRGVNCKCTHCTLDIFSADAVLLAPCTTAEILLPR